MSNIALLVDCLKIISTPLQTQPGSKTERNCAKIGTTTSKPARRRSKPSSRIGSGPSTTPPSTTISPPTSKVRPLPPRFQREGCRESSRPASPIRSRPAKKHVFRIFRQKSQRMDHPQEVPLRKPPQSPQFSKIHRTIPQVRSVLLPLI